MTKNTINMNYFDAIDFRVNQLNELGQKYLNKFTFMSNDEILARLWEIADKLFDEKSGRDWNKCHLIPEWAINFLDGWTPYLPPDRGSLYSLLAFAMVSNDAHLRNLLERAENREKNELNFPVFAEKEIVEKLAGMK